MTEHNPKIDGRTKRALDMAIAKRQVSQESYRAVLAGEITLQHAKAIGRDGAPAADTDRASDGREEATKTPVKGRTPRPCLCGCGQTTRGGRFKPGHDARLHSELKRNLERDPLLRNERFTEEQKAYAKERGLI
jgi:hypothetical protein